MVNQLHSHGKSSTWPVSVRCCRHPSPWENAGSSPLTSWPSPTSTIPPWCPSVPRCTRTPSGLASAVWQTIEFQWHHSCRDHPVQVWRHPRRAMLLPIRPLLPSTTVTATATVTTLFLKKIFYGFSITLHDLQWSFSLIAWSRATVHYFLVIHICNLTSIWNIKFYKLQAIHPIYKYVNWKARIPTLVFRYCNFVFF